MKPKCTIFLVEGNIYFVLYF